MPKTEALSGPSPFRGCICAKLGKTKEVHEVLSTLEALSPERYVPPYATALVHVGLGQHDSALDWLERAYDAHGVFVPVDPKWDSFRADEHFADLLRRCGFCNTR